MNIQEFLQSKLDEGFTLGRLSSILEVSAAALSYQMNGQSKSVSLALAREIYKKFDILLTGFHIDEME